eukprot:TRINITY_DN8045_c5_g1_i1.p1 TRINITY_DN8045_c5_g1~~TRINITY_DN8045_c5_g1_i1.p1  ORF type:complete len:561 (+),score=97.98 TRINITY_DN8045_c5_g1_i1:79-1683(+)
MSRVRSHSAPLAPDPGYAATQLSAAPQGPPPAAGAQAQDVRDELPQAGGRTNPQAAAREHPQGQPHRQSPSQESQPRRERQSSHSAAERAPSHDAASHVSTGDEASSSTVTSSRAEQQRALQDWYDYQVMALNDLPPPPPFTPTPPPLPPSPPPPQPLPPAPPPPLQPQQFRASLQLEHPFSTPLQGQQQQHFPWAQPVPTPAPPHLQQQLPWQPHSPQLQLPQQQLSQPQFPQPQFSQPQPLQPQFPQQHPLGPQYPQQLPQPQLAPQQMQPAPPQALLPAAAPAPSQPHMSVPPPAALQLLPVGTLPQATSVAAAEAGPVAPPAPACAAPPVELPTTNEDLLLAFVCERLRSRRQNPYAGSLALSALHCQAAAQVGPLYSAVVRSRYGGSFHSFIQANSQVLRLFHYSADVIDQWGLTHCNADGARVVFATLSNHDVACADRNNAVWYAQLCNDAVTLMERILGAGPLHMRALVDAFTAADVDGRFKEVLHSRNSIRKLIHDNPARIVITPSTLLKLPHQLTAEERSSPVQQ